MSAVLKIGIGVDDYSHLLCVDLVVSGRSVEVYSTDSIEDISPDQFLDKVGKCLNEALLWRKELLYVPDIVLGDTVAEFADNIEEGLIKKIIKMKKETE